MKKIQTFIMSCVALASISSFSPTIYAADRAGALSLTLGAGPLHLSQRRHLENTGIGYGAVGFNFTDNWGVEGLLGVFNTKFKRNAWHKRDGRAVNGTLFAFDGIYHFHPAFPPCHSVEPYVLAGVGIIGQNKSRNDANNEGNINAGVGVNFFIDKSVAFRVEGRDFYTLVGGKNDVMADVGITFLLDLC